MLVQLSGGAHHSHLYRRFPMTSTIPLGKVGRMHGGYGRPYAMIRGDIKRFSGPGDKRVIHYESRVGMQKSPSQRAHEAFMREALEGFPEGKSKEERQEMFKVANAEWMRSQERLDALAANSQWHRPAAILARKNALKQKRKKQRADYTKQAAKERAERKKEKSKKGKKSKKSEKKLKKKSEKKSKKGEKEKKKKKDELGDELDEKHVEVEGKRSEGKPKPALKKRGDKLGPGEMLIDDLPEDYPVPLKKYGKKQPKEAEHV